MIENQDTEPRAQSCGARTMQCLDPAAARRARALRLEDFEQGVSTQNQDESRSPFLHRCGSQMRSIPNDISNTSPVRGPQRNDLAESPRRLEKGPRF